MNKEEQKYLIALGNLQSMAIDNTKGSKAVEICINGIRTYVDRLNNIISELNEGIYHLLNVIEDNKQDIKVTSDEELAIFSCQNRLEELKEENK